MEKIKGVVQKDLNANEGREVPMKKQRAKRRINVQGTQSITSKVNYQDWLAEHGSRTPEGDVIEPSTANPDSLPFTENEISEAALIMGEAVEHLQGRQLDVYIMSMRQDMSEREIANALGISRSSVMTYKQRAIDFVTRYCESQMWRVEGESDGC